MDMPSIAVSITVFGRHILLSFTLVYAPVSALLALLVKSCQSTASGRSHRTRRHRRLRSSIYTKKFHHEKYTMIHITGRLQLPDFGLDAYMQWQPTYFENLWPHLTMALTFDIVIFPRIPLIQFDYTSNFAYAEH